MNELGQTEQTLTNETQRRITTVTSSLNEISADQLENIVVVRVGGVAPPVPNPFYTVQKASGLIFKEDVNSLSSTSDIFLWNIVHNVQLSDHDFSSYFSN